LRVEAERVDVTPADLDDLSVASSELRQRLVAILAADVAGYSRLMSQDERATVEALDAAREIFRSHIEANQGRVIDMAGDSVLAVFETATGAVSAALVIQHAINALADAVPERQRMRFRIGIHLGDLMEKADGTVYGDGVNIAARLEALGEPGGVTISDSIRIAVKGKILAEFEDMGEQQVKNIADPVRAYRLREERSAQSQPAPLAEYPAPTVEFDLALPDKPSIAVLPFTNMSGDPEQEYFADGITEDIITELSRFHSLFVIARNSSFAYKGKPVDVRTVSRELGVRYVLEGSIRRSGNRIRVTAQLIDAIIGSHIWAEKYDRVLEDIFAVQEEVTRSIVSAAMPTVMRVEEFKARRRHKNLTAYELVVRARTCLRDGVATSDRVLVGKGLEAARAALVIDPDNSVALTTLASVQGFSIMSGFAPDPAAAMKEGMDAADRAIRLDATGSEGYVAKGFLLFWKMDENNFEQARFLLRRAIELNSNDWSAWWALGTHEATAGSPETAIDLLRLALRLSPLDPIRYRGHMMLAVSLFAIRDYAAALVEIGKAMAESPKDGYLRIFASQINVALGDLVSARAAFVEAQRLAPELVQRRLDGISPIRNAELRNRGTVFLRIAAGLDQPSAADLLR
jgi:adenylate cyclase